MGDGRDSEPTDNGSRWHAGDDVARRPDVRYRDPASLGTEDLLRLIVGGRTSDEAADRAAAAKASKLLLAAQLDRVEGLVKAFVFPGRPGVRVPADHVDDAVQNALVRLLQVLDRTVRTTEEGAFRALVARVVKFACMDLCRSLMRIDLGIEGSLDEPARGAHGDGDDASGGRFDGVMAGRAAPSAADAAEERERLDELLGAVDLLPTANMREVVRFKLLGSSSAEVGLVLGLAPGNVDQLFSRGRRQLRERLGW